MIVYFNWCSIELMVGWLVGWLVYDCDYDCEYDSCERKNWFGVLFFLLHFMSSCFQIMICIHQRILIQTKKEHQQKIRD